MENKNCTALIIVNTNNNLLSGLTRYYTRINVRSGRYSKYMDKKDFLNVWKNKEVLNPVLYRKVFINNGTITGTLAQKEDSYNNNDKTVYTPVYCYPFSVPVQLEKGYKKVGFGIPTIIKYINEKEYNSAQHPIAKEYNGKDNRITNRGAELEREYNANKDTKKHYLETGETLDCKVTDNTHNTSDKTEFCIVHNDIIAYIAKRVQRTINLYAIKNGMSGKSYDLLIESYQYFGKDKIINSDFSDIVNIVCFGLFNIAKNNKITLKNMIKCFELWEKTTNKKDKNRYNYLISDKGITAQTIYDIINKSVNDFLNDSKHLTVTSRIAYYTDKDGNLTNKPVPMGQVTSALKAHTAKYAETKVISLETYTAEMGDTIPGKNGPEQDSHPLQDLYNLCNTAGLTPKERDIFIYINYMGYTKTEISSHLETTKQNVGQIYQKANNKLKKYVHNNWFIC